jgi:hypothetical protein
MAEVTNKKMVSQIINKIGHEQYEKMLKNGKGKSDAVIHRAIMKELNSSFTNEELIDAVLGDAVADGWKKITKQGSISSVLAAKSQEEAFPLELDRANIHMNSTTVPLRDAGVDVVELQERAYIDNKIKQDKAFARNMSVIGPIRSLMLENGCTAGEAMDILREREE